MHQFTAQRAFIKAARHTVRKANQNTFLQSSVLAHQRSMPQTVYSNDPT
jgi:hypothetical protein